MKRKKFHFLGIITCVGALSLFGCTSSDAIDGPNAEIIGQLSMISPAAVNVTDPQDVECWLPLDHMVNSNTFRVICRISFEGDGVDRYRDAICVGNPNTDPVTEYCYEWAFYSDMPVYEDFPGHSVDAHLE